jgi:ubiquinone/menaquinone biosynthesis C-methylase UbiE
VDARSREPAGAVIPQLFDLVSARAPALKSRLWRAWYDYLARACRDADWRFMNFGFVDLDPGSQRLELSEEDEPDRLWIQLYHRAAATTVLRGRDVLEVGCGRGGGASYIRRYLSPRSIVGLDPARHAIDLCRRHHSVAGLSFVHGDAEILPFADAVFDVVLSIEGSHCHASMERALVEASRVLRPGGRLVLADVRSAPEVDTVRAQVQTSGLALLGEHLVTDNVLAALERGHDRKLTLIRQKIPRLFRAQFRQFAGLAGSHIYEGLRSRRFVYFIWALGKDGMRGSSMPVARPEARR